MFENSLKYDVAFFFNYIKRKVPMNGVNSHVIRIEIAVKSDGRFLNKAASLKP